MPLGPGRAGRGVVGSPVAKAAVIAKPGPSPVAKAAVIESAPVTITGITAATSVTVTGGEFSVGCMGTYGTAASTITNGQTICARHTSSATGATAVNTVVTIGGVSDTFSSTTLADPDTTPAAFSFTDIEDVERSAVQTSNAITQDLEKQLRQILGIDHDRVLHRAPRHGEAR